MNPLDETQALLYSAYFPNIQYFTKIVLHNHLLIEHFEHYPKQTYRTRCYIQASNGKLSLSIPLKNSLQHTPIKDMRIAYDEPWQRLHWRSITTAYRCSPFFEYYEDYFAPFYEKNYTFLIDFNHDLLKTLLKCIKINPTISFTESYQKSYPPELVTDYRSVISLKAHIPDTHFEVQPYTQVFSDKIGFMPNLTILDVLCNEGPHTLGYLSSCLVDCN